MNDIPRVFVLSERLRKEDIPCLRTGRHVSVGQPGINLWHRYNKQPGHMGGFKPSNRKAQ